MSDSEFYLENGTNIFNGTIDGEKVPRLQIEWRNGSQVATGREGNYINEIGFSFSNSTYYKWNGKSWETVSDLQNLTEATRLYRNRVEYANEAEKLRLKAYETAIEPIGYTSLRYPANVSTGEHSDFVLFDFFDYQPPFKNNTNFETKVDNSFLFGGTKKKRSFVNEKLPEYNRSGQAGSLYKRDDTGRFPQIMLYMPDDISDTLKADWEGKSFGSTTAGILSSAGTDGIVEKLKQAGNETGKGLSKAPVELAASLITNLAKGITGDSINTGDVFGSIDGVIRNPNVEVLFQRMNL